MPTIRRRSLLALAGAPLLAQSTPEPELEWHDPATWGVEGRGWTGEPRLRYYDRFPARGETMAPPPVWRLSRDSAGMALRFRTDAASIWVDYTLRSDRLALPHMPATGVSGMDLYGALPGAKLPRWVQVTRPAAQKVRAAIANGLDAGLREYTMYLPLYNGVDELKVGLPKGAKLEPVAPRQSPPIVFYGTSIMHGACASRPGMAIPALIGRRFNRPTVNLGFSGNGRMDAGVAKLITDLPAAAICIDCLPNMNAALVTERTAPLVETIRKGQPNTPIVLVEDRVFANAPFFKGSGPRHDANHAALRREFEKLTAAGVRRLHYLEGNQLIGDDGEGTVDGSHPNDLGFVRYADAYERVLRPIIG